MDLLTMVQLGMFLPFLLFLAFFLVSYLRNGYKNDFGRALVYFVATIVSTILSTLLAKGISLATAKPLAALIPAQLTESMEFFGTLGDTLIQAAIEIVLSFLLFGAFFVITLPILKAIGKKLLWDKLHKLNPEKTGSRLAGMGIRGIEALWVCVMLLLPIYGTIAMVAPTASKAISLSESLSAYSETPEIAAMPEQRGIIEPQTEADAEYSDDEPAIAEQSTSEDQTLVILDAVANHPILLPYKYGPGSWVYSGLSSFSMNGKTVDIASAADSLDGMLDRVQRCWEAIEAQDTEKTLDAVQELISYTRKKVIYQRWSYDMLMAFVAEADTLFETHAEEFSDNQPTLDAYKQLRPLLDMTFDEYTHNAEGILDFAGYAVEVFGNYSVGVISEEDLAKKEEEMYSRLGDLLNYSDQIVEAKRVILTIYANHMYEALPYRDDPNYTDYYAGRKNLPNTGAEFVDKYFGDGIVPEKDRLAEGSAFILLLNDPDSLNSAEVFVRHPMFGADAVLEAMDERLYTHGTSDLGINLTPTSNKDGIYKELDNMLRAYENAPFNQPLSFSAAVYNYMEEQGCIPLYEHSELYEYGELSNGANVNIMF